MGESIPELQARTLPLVQEVLMRRLPQASDDALLGFIRMWVGQLDALLRVSPKLCYEYAFPSSGPTKNFTRYFSQELQQWELNALTQIIQTADESRQIPTESEMNPLIKRLFAKLHQSMGKDALLLAQLSDPKALAKIDKSKTCAVLSGYYKAIMQLPKRDAARLLRYTFASEK